MKRLVTVLFTSVGRRVELQEIFRSTIADMGYEPRILATDANPSWSAACRLADRAFVAPRSYDPDFPAFVARLARRYEVDVVVPTADHDLLPLAALRETLSVRRPWFNVSSSAVVKICRDKLATARVLAEAGVRVPATQPLCDSHTMDGQRVIAKPRDGSSSIGVIGPLEWNAASRSRMAGKPYIVQEYISGEEYTTTAYFNRDGSLEDVCTHRRIRVRGGEVEKAVLENETEFEALAAKIGRALSGLYGVICFQTIWCKKAGELRVIEINARFGGGFPLVHAAGFRFVEFLISDALGSSRTPHGRQPRRDGLGMVRYEHSLVFEVGSDVWLEKNV